MIAPVDIYSQKLPLQINSWHVIMIHDMSWHIMIKTLFISWKASECYKRWLSRTICMFNPQRSPKILLKNLFHHLKWWVFGYMSGFKGRVKTDISRWQATKYATITQWGALIHAWTPEASRISLPLHLQHVHSDPKPWWHIRWRATKICLSCASPYI